MKTTMRLVHFVLAAQLLLVSLAGCMGTGGNVPNGQTGSENFQKNMHQSNDTALAELCETDGGIYFEKDDYLYYLDKGTKRATVLCGKPDCTHNSTACNAWLNATGMWYTGGKLYCQTISGEREVLSLQADGTERKMVQELAFSSDASSSSCSEAIYHRGMVYCVWDNVLYSVPLGEKPENAKAIWGDRTGETWENRENRYTLWADGDTVYCMAGLTQPDGTGKDTLFAYDTGSGEVRQVWITPDGSEVGDWNRTGVSPSQWYVVHGEIYYFLAGNGLWKSNLNTGGTVKLADTTQKVPYGLAVFSDQYMCLIRDATHGDNTGGETFFVYDLTGTLLKELSLADLYRDIGPASDCAPICISGEDLYFLVRAAEGAQKVTLCCGNIETGAITQVFQWDW